MGLIHARAEAALAWRNSTVTHRLLTAAIVSAAIAMSCARPLPPEEPLAVSPVEIGEGEQRTASNILLVTDSSGTMYGNETFPKAKALSESLIMALPETDARGETSQYNVGTIGFGGDERVESELAPFDREGALGTVRNLEIMGSIDGLPDDSDAALAAALNLSEVRRDEVCFHGIQLGDDPAGAQFLGELAATTPCGSMRNASSIDDVQSFERFAKSTVVGAAALPAVSAAPAACGTIRLRGIEFGFDSASIDDSGAAVLDMAVELLDECASVSVGVEGHTDSTGAEGYNRGLSERRAGSVEQYLSGQGVAADRLSTEGFGESKPVATNDTSEGRARNRRVELVPR
jgi:outer membrane protein OmpA-like peptidoglycan-associated protein